MERRIIRQRWQITIPPGIRRKLNLFQGQLLNFDLVEIEGEVFIRVFTGQAMDPTERAAFQEIYGRKKGQPRGKICRRKIGKSAGKRELRLSRIEDIRQGLVPSTASELQEIISNLSGYLLSLQSRLRSSPGESTERPGPMKGPCS